MLIHPGKRAPLARGRQEDWDEAREGCSESEFQAEDYGYDHQLGAPRPG